jgi:hypothetical protein
MLYNQLEWMLLPFFLWRWWDDLANWDIIQHYINLAIQDIYNRNNWVFKFKTETLSTYEDNTTNNTRMFTSLENIHMFTWNICDQDWNPIFPTVWRLQDIYEFNFSWKNIYFKLNDWTNDTTITSIEITYSKTYTFYNKAIDWLKEVPLPESFIPALIKLVYDYASPINLFDWEQTQVDFYWHFNTRMNDLLNADWITESIQFIPVKYF